MRARASIILDQDQMRRGRPQLGRPRKACTQLEFSLARAAPAAVGTAGPAETRRAVSSPTNAGGLLDRRVILCRRAQGCRCRAGGRLGVPRKQPPTDHRSRYAKSNRKLTHSRPPQIANTSPKMSRDAKKILQLVVRRHSASCGKVPNANALSPSPARRGRRCHECRRPQARRHKSGGRRHRAALPGRRHSPRAAHGPEATLRRP
jgi:hypothetical protein